MACLPLFYPFFIFFVLVLSFYSCVCLLLCSLSFFALVVFICSLALSSLFLFPLRTIRKKKGRKGFAPCVLSSFVVGCLIWSLLCTPRTRQGSIRQYRNKVLEKGNLNGCSKFFCALRCSCLYSSKFVLFLFSYLCLLVGSYFLFPFRLLCCIRDNKTICSRFYS